MTFVIDYFTGGHPTTSEIESINKDRPYSQS